MSPVEGQKNICAYESWETKGFAISSKPSTGLRSVIVGPRQTTKPSCRVVSVVSVAESVIEAGSTRQDRTCLDVLDYIVEHEVE